MATLLRLVWQHWRQSSWTALAILGAMLVPVMIIAARWVGDPDRWYYDFDRDPFLFWFGLVPLLAMVPLLGLCVFLSDQRKGRLRLLRDCGVPPKYVWLSRQSVLLPMAVLTLPVFLSLAYFLAPYVYLPERQEHVRYTSAACACMFAYIVLSLTVGQLCSMVIRSTILAAIISLLLTVVLVVWCGLMLLCQINPLWSILPIPVALLLATRLHTNDWLLERNGPRAWLRPGLALLVPTVALLIAVPLYRIYQVPVIGSDPYFDEYQGTATGEEQATMDIYGQATSKYLIASAEKNAVGMKDAVALLVKASRQKLRHRLKAQLPSRGEVRLGAPLGWALQQLPRIAKDDEKKGNLDAALELYLTAIRVSGQVRQCDWRGREFAFADTVEADVHRRLASWAAAPKQTPERILAAERQLREATPRVTPSDGAKMQHVLLSRALKGDLIAIHDGAQTERRPDQWVMAIWLRLPWERVRALRLLNLQTRWDIEARKGSDPDKGFSMDNATRGLMDRARVRLAPLQNSELLSILRSEMHMQPISDDWDKNNGWDRSYTLSRSHRAVETARRAVRVVLALEAWKLKNGSLPKSLDELTGKYLDSIPDDPYSGMPFHYVRDGVKIPLHWQQPLSGWMSSDASGVVPANQPFIWSIGEKIGITTSSKDDILDQYMISEWPHGSPSGRNNWPRHATSKFELWQGGWPFPIP